MRSSVGRLGDSSSSAPHSPQLDRILTSLMDASSQLSFEGFVENGGQERGKFGSGLDLEFVQHIHIRSRI